MGHMWDDGALSQRSPLRRSRLSPGLQNLMEIQQIVGRKAGPNEKSVNGPSGNLTLIEVAQLKAEPVTPRRRSSDGTTRTPSTRCRRNSGGKTSAPSIPRGCDSGVASSIPENDGQLEPEVMNLVEAADFLRCHPKTLRLHAVPRNIPHKRLGSSWRFYRPKLVAWMEQDR